MPGRARDGPASGAGGAWHLPVEAHDSVRAGGRLTGGRAKV